MSTVADFSLPTVEEIKRWSRDDVRKFLQDNKVSIDLDNEDIDKIYDQKVKGTTFLELTQEELKSIGIALGPSKEIGKLINQIKDQSVASPSKLVYVFIDNSNVFIEGKKETSRHEPIDENSAKVDYGNLLKTVLDGRPMGADPVIVGSRPPPNDTLWESLKRINFYVKVFDRNSQNQEKGVDSEITCCMLDTVHDHNPGTIILIAGDRDFEPAIQRALVASWIIEIWSWSKALSFRFKRLSKTTRTTIKHLDKYYKAFMFAHCRNDKAMYLEFSTRIDRVKRNDVMEFYKELGLFAWWNWPHKGTWRLYVDNSQQLENMKRLIMRKYRSARISYSNVVVR